ncbi:aldo/keto reductase [Histomonas meleagridis]|uniref:aldo/keto reductase n=1 Tax=Histomonas meleagridis TaxID=135588 RepID=UPI0035599CE1|nr:aldo/keto reductase [Histomonas meleagridis]KAH0799317.1 aldo/keto reductase [Histomonas meleagridis]
MMKSIRLNNGVEMPMIGYGVYLIPSNKTEQCVLDALNTGYRSIDTAQCYGNEHEVGLAVKKSGIPREQVFITTKLWGCRGYQDTVKSINGSLRELDLGYIDLLLIHEPTGNYLEIYRAMEDAYNEGKLRSIGVANFLEDDFMKLVNNCRVIPAVNQVETHVFRQQKNLVPLLQKYGTAHEAWSPVAAGKNRIFKNPVLVQIAKAHGKTTAQIALKFLYQQNIIIIPKSTHIERMRENLQVDDFELTENELNEIRALDKGKSLFGWW